MTFYTMVLDWMDASGKPFDQPRFRESLWWWAEYEWGYWQVMMPGE